MLSYTYVYRFLLKGKLKKIFCDFELKELESSIEKLDRLNEQKEPLISFLEENELFVGSFMLSKKFCDRKAEVVNKKEILKKHFKHLMTMI